MSASDFANVYASINNLQNQFDAITGNTLSNYNQLSRIVAQQGNIYNSVYYGSGNIVTGTLVVNNNMGINTSTPLANLHITGNAIITGNVNVNNGNIFMNRFGNLGIGTTNPTVPLQVIGDANISGNVIISGTISAGSPIIAAYNPSTLTSNTYIGFQGSSTNNTAPTTSATTIFTISLPAGVWLLEGESDYINTTSSLRVVGFNTATSFDTTRSQNVTSTVGVALRVTTVYSLTATTTIYFLTANSTGTPSTVINSLRYTRIA